MGRTILVFEMFTITASVEPSVYWYHGAWYVVPQVPQALYGRVLTSGNDTSQEGSQLDENEIISKLSNSAITGAIAVR